jgi:hypothetical protein
MRRIAVHTLVFPLLLIGLAGRIEPQSPLPATNPREEE